MRPISSFCLILTLFITSYLSSCKNGSNKKDQSKEIPAGEVSVDDFEKKLSSTTNPQIVDVRTPEEYESGHLLAAINIDWNGTDFDEKITALDKTRPAFVYCQSGNRSHAAAVQMKKLGFTEIYEMDGGIKAWKKGGKSVTPATTEEIREMTIDDFNSRVNSDKLVLVDFNAPWCAPCKTMEPILDEIATEQKDHLVLMKINSDNNTKLAGELKVDALPTMILYKHGKKVWTHQGATDKIELMVVIDALKK